MSTRRAPRFTSFAESSNIGPDALDQIRDEMVDLANAYIREPAQGIDRCTCQAETGYTPVLVYREDLYQVARPIRAW